MSGSTTPAGWYPDPETPGQQRWWDGTAWAAPTPAPPVADAPVADSPPPFPGYAVPPPPQGGYVPPTSGYGAPAYGTTQVGYGYAQGGGELAGFADRLVAYLIDGLLVGVPFGIAFAIASGISDALGYVVYAVGLVGVVYYFARFEGGPDGQTIGKKQMGIRVVDATSMQPGIGVGRGVGRYFSRILSSFLCALGYLWMLWDPERQTWHDKIVGTKVVKG